MNKKIMHAALVAGSLLVSTAAFASGGVNYYVTPGHNLGGYTSTNGSGVFTFDDIAANFLAPIANGYQGLNWDNFSALNVPAFNAYDTATNPSGYDTLVYNESLPNVAFNGGGAPADFATANAANFTDVQFDITSAWRDNLIVTLQGYENGVAVVGDVARLDLADPFTIYHVDISWNDVNGIGFTSTGGSKDAGVAYDGTQFAIDSVPEPEQYAMLLLGLPLIGSAVRKRQSKI